MSTDVVKKDLDSIIDYLKELSDSDLIQIWNHYCLERANNPDSMIYENDEEFFEMWGAEVMEVVRAISFGDYTYSHKFITFNGYGNLETSDYAEDWVDIDELANDILEDEFEYSEFLELEETEEDDDE